MGWGLHKSDDNTDDSYSHTNSLTTTVTGTRRSYDNDEHFRIAGGKVRRSHLRIVLGCSVWD